MGVSCTIIISHYESINFLRACIRQIRKYAHPDVEQHIIVADQSGDDVANRVSNEYYGDEDVSTRWMKPLWSGYGIDWLIRNENIDTDYICQIHVDAFPIHKNWLYMPIKLIEENNFSFIGQLQCINIDSSIYPSSPFFAMAQCFNIAKTETYREMSMEAGFTRFHNRLDSKMEFGNNDWAEWAKEDYQARGSDDDIVAFSWEDRHLEHNKLGLAISGYIESNYGRIIDDIVFHFGSANEARGNFDRMPELYQQYIKRINEDYSDSLIDEMVALAKANRPPNMEILSRNYWNGDTKTHHPPSEQLNKRIEGLKYE